MHVAGALYTHMHKTNVQTYCTQALCGFSLISQLYNSSWSPATVCPTLLFEQTVGLLVNQNCKDFGLNGGDAIIRFSHFWYHWIMMMVITNSGGGSTQTVYFRKSTKKEIKFHINFSAKVSKHLKYSK